MIFEWFFIDLPCSFSYKMHQFQLFYVFPKNPSLGWYLSLTHTLLCILPVHYGFYLKKKTVKVNPSIEKQWESKVSWAISKDSGVFRKILIQIDQAILEFFNLKHFEEPSLKKILSLAKSQEMNKNFVFSQ